MTTPGHRFEHFAGSHHRPRVELSRGDRALAGRLRDADEILRGFGRIGEVGEGPLAGHRHVGAQRQVQRDLDPQLPRLRDLHLPSYARKIDEAEHEIRGPGATLSNA